MKRKIIAFILAVALVMGLCLTGCSGSSYIAIVNGEKVPVGWYVSNAVYTAAQMEQTYGEAYYISFLKLPNATDPTRTNAQVLDDAAKAAFEQNYTYKLMVDELGLTLDSIGQEALDAEFNFLKQTFYSKDHFTRFLKLSGINEAEYKEMYKVSTYYPDMLYDYYFDEEVGVDKYDKATIKEFYDAYTEYCMKHILFTYATTDAKGNPLTEAEISANKDKAYAEAKDTLAKIESGELEFDAAMNTLSDDASLSTYPTGYAWAEGDGMLPEIFTTAAKEMNVGDMKLYESESGYHIMLELDKDEYFDSHYVVYETAYTQNYLAEKIAEYKQNHVLIEYNEAALKKYQFMKMGSVNVTLLSLTEDSMANAAQQALKELYGED